MISEIKDSIPVDSCFTTAHSFLDKAVDTFNNAEAVETIFLLSSLLIMLVYIIKSQPRSKDAIGYWNVALDFPLDLCIVTITVIVTFFVARSKGVFGFLLLLLTILVCYFCNLTKKKSSVPIHECKIGGWRAFIGLVGFIVCVAWMIFVYRLIKWYA